MLLWFRCVQVGCTASHLQRALHQFYIDAARKVGSGKSWKTAYNFEFIHVAILLLLPSLHWSLELHHIQLHLHTVCVCVLLSSQACPVVMWACLMVLWSRRSCVKASLRLFISACLFLTLPGGMLCVQKVSPCHGKLGQCCQNLTLQAGVEMCFKDKHHSTRISLCCSSNEWQLNQSVCLGGATPGVVWWLCCVCRHRLCQSEVVSLQLVTLVADFHPSLLWLGHLSVSFQWGFFHTLRI